MHKKLASDLTSLAHSILQLKNKEDVFVLKQKAYEVYEKLAVLAYVEEYINTTPNTDVTKEELIAKIESVQTTINEPLNKETTTVVHNLEKEEIKKTDATDNFADTVIEKIEEEKEDNFIEQPFEDLEKIFATNNNVKDDVKDIGDKKMPTLEEELQDTISVDTVINLFKKVEKKSLNDQFLGSIQIGLNDRIAFVKHLFSGNQEDFNRVVSQLNTFKMEKEAKSFISKMVKPDYDWSEKEIYERRLLEIIERRFN